MMQHLHLLLHTFCFWPPAEQLASPCRPVLHRYINDPRLYGSTPHVSAQAGSLGPAEAKSAFLDSVSLRSHPQWVCEASQHWRTDGCNKVWAFGDQGKATALGLLLGQSHYFEDHTHEAAMDVLSTVRFIPQ